MDKTLTEQASGTFEVTLTPQEDSGFTAGEGLGRASLAKTFEGDLAGEGHGQILTAVSKVKGSAGYVGIEYVRATLAGKRGGFVLQHSSTMDRGVPVQSVQVVPDSGFGELKGIHGEMTITIKDGAHLYEFRYAFPPAE